MFLGMPSPPPYADVSAFKRAINQATEAANAKKDFEAVSKILNPLRDNLTRNPAAVPDYNKMYKEKTLLNEEIKNTNQRYEENRSHPEINKQEIERIERERRKAIEELERRRKELEEETMRWLVMMTTVAEKDDAERRSRQIQVTGAYIISMVLSIIVAFVYGELAATIATWWVITIIPTILMILSKNRTRALAWVVIIVLAVGVLVGVAFMALAALVDASAKETITSALLTIAFALPIYPIYKAFISAKTASDKDMEENAYTILAKEFGEARDM